jgi:hypothetical protein
MARFPRARAPNTGEGYPSNESIEDWEALPPALRDPLAARAFISEWGYKGRALIRLGFPAMNNLSRNRVQLYNDHVTRVFDTPGVQAILKRDLSRIDLERDAMLSRLSWIALADDDGQSLKAIDLLAKVCGCNTIRRHLRQRQPPWLRATLQTSAPGLRPEGQLYDAVHAQIWRERVGIESLRPRCASSRVNAPRLSSCVSASWRRRVGVTRCSS